MSDYDAHVAEVLKQVPDADPDKVSEAFARYEKDFLIPPEDAMRSVLRRFQSDTGTPAQSSQQASSNQRQNIPIKKVEKLYPENLQPPESKKNDFLQEPTKTY